MSRAVRFGKPDLRNAEVTLMTATALIAVLVTAGAGAMGYPAIRDVISAEASHPMQEPPVAQAPPGSTGAKPGADQGPVVIQVDVLDSEGHRLSGADVVVRLYYSRSSGNSEQVIERIKTDGAGHVQLEVARERQSGILRSARVSAYEPGRALAMSTVLLTGKASPPAIQLTLNEPAKWTVTVLGADDRPIEGLRLSRPIALPLPSRSSICGKAPAIRTTLLTWNCDFVAG